LPKAKDPRRVADFWTRKAKKEKYPARSVYKLIEVDKKHRLLKPNDHVLDLGASPGSWMKYAAERVGPQGLVLGLDLKPLEIDLAPNMRFSQIDLYEADLEHLGVTKPVTIVLSDLAPSTTGNKVVDQARSAELSEAALEVCQKVLAQGGSFLVKVFQGPDTNEFFKTLRTQFKTVSREKPKSSRRISPEIFLLAQGFKKNQSG
jgi:23S rRNA (uridine2552-2'-O)-methyltransferase